MAEPLRSFPWRGIRGEVEERKQIYKRDEGFKGGYEEAMNIEHFTVPCNICGKPMRFSSRDKNLKDEKRVLIRAFKTGIM